MSRNTFLFGDYTFEQEKNMKAAREKARKGALRKQHRAKLHKRRT